MARRGGVRCSALLGAEGSMALYLDAAAAGLAVVVAADNMPKGTMPVLDVGGL